MGIVVRNGVKSWTPIPEEIEIGMAVEVVFEEVNAEITLPKFKRVS